MKIFRLRQRNNSNSLLRLAPYESRDTFLNSAIMRFFRIDGRAVHKARRTCAKASYADRLPEPERALSSYFAFVDQF